MPSWSRARSASAAAQLEQLARPNHDHDPNHSIPMITVAISSASPPVLAPRRLLARCCAHSSTAGRQAHSARHSVVGGCSRSSVSHSPTTELRDNAALKEVVKTFYDNGGRVLDATLGNAVAEQFHITRPRSLASEQGILVREGDCRGGGGAPPGPEAVKAQVDSFLSRTKASKIDLAWLAAAGNPQAGRAKEEKKRDE